MKIGLVSDTHHEIYGLTDHKWWDELQDKLFDVLVLAGDIGTVEDIKYICKIISTKCKHVILVHGNHECYKSARVIVVEALKSLSESIDNVHFLDNSSIEIDGKVFYGGCLWTNFDNNPINIETCLHCLNDFRMIRDMWGHSGAFTMLEQHQQFIDNAPDNIDVCVSHFSPSFQGVTEEFRGSLINCYFHNNLETFMETHNVKYWLHGHIHQSVEYTHHDTTIIANPLGYHFERKLPYTIKEIIIDD